MNFAKDFFEERGFDFKNDFKSKKISIPTNEDKLSEINLLFYKNPQNTNTSFYILISDLTHSELEETIKHIWNENEADLFFAFQKTNNSNLFGDEFLTNLYYTKLSPKTPKSKKLIYSFSGKRKDIKELEKINKWQFDSGLFWYNYIDFLDKVKRVKRIDKELILTLERLRKGLLKKVIEEDKVQALIDRTLYIKYLEDNHIINSYFYDFYFEDVDLTYKELLISQKPDNLNKLFKIIHKIFNNNLFDQPIIEEKYLTQEVCKLIYDSISGKNEITGQLSLFDFKFDIIPVEFISYIYEIFLSNEQKENGIYYTPKKLAQLIIDDVILDKKIGKVLDPSCGSGMFLIVAFQKLLEDNPPKDDASIDEKIQHRIKLLSENIFGIEKQNIAQRFTLFSLSLQIFRGLDSEEIKEFIDQELKAHNEVKLFKDYSFFDNIKQHNSLDIDNSPFENLEFDYIVGNPPFFEINGKNEEHKKEVAFIKEYETIINDCEIKAKDIIGQHQISQCFLLKIKDWSNKNTRFGFVSNNSNFYNDNSTDFQKFFYKNYSIEKIYELSKVKKILFEKAKESVNALIFNNLSVNNTIDYYPVEMGLFSEKPFELLIIQEDKILNIKQENLLTNKVRLRDYLLGNEFDLKLIKKLSDEDKLESYLSDNQKTYRGIERIENIRLSKYFNLSLNEFKALSKDDKNSLHQKFANKYYLSKKPESNKYKPYLYYAKNIEPFKLNEFNHYINIDKINKDYFRRTGSEEAYKSPKILFNRFGDRLNAVYIETYMAYSTYIFSILLKNNSDYHLIVAILNSDLINYFLPHAYKKRLEDNFANIDTKAIKNIPIPKELDSNLISKISKKSKELIEGKYTYEGKTKETLNELIYDLYNLSYNEKQRVKDYFISKSQVSNANLKNYLKGLIDTIGLFFKNSIQLDYHHYKDFNLVVFGIFINGSIDNNPSTKKVSKYTLNEIFKQDPTENFLASQEKVFGKNCIYILKKDDNTNWSETKAYEDGQEILKKLLNG